MEWLVIIGLAIWAGFQERRIGRLEQAARQTAPRPMAQPAAAIAAATVRAEPATAAKTEVTPVAIASAVAQPSPTPPAPPPAPRAPGRSPADWLAENGLAWMGGGGLMLGGLFLAVYAAERGFFTPQLRIAAALAAGALMIAASEWIRRRPEIPGGRHLLAASLTAGAGAATVYGAVWAAWALYRFIPFEAAAVLIAGVSLGLLALALIHGEGLAAMALVGAFLAPAIIEPARWNAAALDAYLVAILATGFAVSGLRRWGVAGLLSLVAGAIWTAMVLKAQAPALGGLLVVAPVVLAIAAVQWRVWRRGEAPGGSTPFDIQPAAALGIASVLSIKLSILHADTAAGLAAGAGVSAALAIAGATMARLKQAPAAVYAAPAAAPAIGLLLALAAHRLGPAFASPVAQALVFVEIAAIGGAALLATRAMTASRTTLIGAGALGAAILANLDWMIMSHGHQPLSWVLPATVGAAMALGAAVLARRVEDRKADLGLGLWIAASAELLFLTIHAGVPYHFAPPVHAAAALGLALLARRLGWRGLAQSAVAGGLVVLATVLRPAFVGDVLAWRLGAGMFDLVVTLAAIQLFAGAHVLLGAQGSETESDALSTAAILVALSGAFLLIHLWLAGGQPGQRLNGFTEAGLRTDLILTTAWLLALRARGDAGWVAKWRMIVFLAAGFVYGLFAQGLIRNPWWGDGGLVAGPPIVDLLSPAYLAPAILLAGVARRGVPRARRWTAAAAAAAFGWAALWVVMEIRHAFHGPHMGPAPIGRAEGAAYAITVLVAARALFAIKSRRAADARLAWLAAAGEPLAWPLLILATIALCIHASPWWGPIGTPFASLGEGALLLGLIGAGAGAGLWLCRAADLAGRIALARAALVAAAADLFVALTLAVRWAYNGADMRGASLHAGLETWSYSAAWAAFGLGALVIGALRASVTLRWVGLAVLLGTVAKVLLFDMARLDGVIRAASFLAVGALLLVGALAARRLNAQPLARAATARRS